MICPLIVCIRHTTDWSKMTEKDLVHPDLWMPEGVSVHDGMTLWKKITDADFFSVRFQLKRMALNNWCHLNNLGMIVDLTYIDANNFVDQLNTIYDDYLILPTDDDDWFNPEIYSVLIHHLRQNHCIRWSSARYDCVKRGSVFFKDNKLYPESNSYCITKSGISLMDALDRDIFLKNHLKLNDLEKKYDLKSVFLSDKLSLYNYHHASISYLMLSYRNRSLLKKTIWGYNNCPVVGGDLLWAQPFLNEFCNYMNSEVFPKAKFFL